jgi:anti-sigma factor RsiW
MSRDPQQLLSAYVDGVAELDGDERKQVEALLEADATARADETATRALIGSLRELPSEGVEPNWNELEASIAKAVGDKVPRPWWRSWRWLLPTTSLAATAAVAILWLQRSPPEAVESTAHVAQPPPASVEPAPLVLWLDDQPIDLGAADTDQLLLELDHEIEAAELASDEDATPLAPADDLGWVDNLDDKALERAERLLEHKKS